MAQRLSTPLLEEDPTPNEQEEPERESSGSSLCPSSEFSENRRIGNSPSPGASFFRGISKILVLDTG
jgi:hypothetical protein